MAWEHRYVAYKALAIFAEDTVGYIRPLYRRPENLNFLCHWNPKVSGMRHHSSAPQSLNLKIQVGVLPREQIVHFVQVFCLFLLRDSILACFFLSSSLIPFQWDIYLSKKKGRPHWAQRTTTSAQISWPPTLNQHKNTFPKGWWRVLPQQGKLRSCTYPCFWSVWIFFVQICIAESSPASQSSQSLLKSATQDWRGV